MDWRPIEKHLGELTEIPNLVDYEHERADFDPGSIHVDGLPGGGLNIAYEAVDRHAAGGLANRTAIRWLGRRGDRRDITYAELKHLTDRFAGALRSLGIGPGDRVFVLAGRIPELYIAVLGTLKNRSVAAPLFSAFGPEPIATRFNLGQGAVLVTTELLYRRRSLRIQSRHSPEPSPRHPRR